MKKIFLIILFCSFYLMNGQEIVNLKDTYIENGLTYKINDNQLFSGQAQKVRKNGHLVYEEFIENGSLIKTVVYFNRTEKPIPALVTEFHQNSFDKKKETRFGYLEPWIEYTHFDKNGGKTLIEKYTSEELTYRCEYSSNKKHGTEFCFDKNGKELKIEYRNGKKIKEK